MNNCEKTFVLSIPSEPFFMFFFTVKCHFPRVIEDLSVIQLKYAIQGKYLGKGPVDNDPSLILWRLLNLTGSELSTIRIPVLAPLILIQSAKHILYVIHYFFEALLMTGLREYHRISDLKWL